jgi:dipeptidyl aminopeptidase/acylaminoacyl peptidase
MAEDLTMTLSMPYGTWPSPVTEQVACSAGPPPWGTQYVDGLLWWSEIRPQERGRATVMASLPSEAGATEIEAREVLPAPWSAFSRVHEYGGGAWVGVVGEDGTVLYFVEQTDQRIYKLQVGHGQEPVPLTPVSSDCEVRFGDLTFDKARNKLLAVRETHGEEIKRDIVVVDVLSTTCIRSVVGNSDFVAYPQPDPSSRLLAWISWNHPDMPWDSSELRIGTTDGSGAVTEWSTVVGGGRESVIQPIWRDSESLYVISDRTGWWNVYLVRISLTDGLRFSVEEVTSVEAEIGGPLWALGSSWATLTESGELACIVGGAKNSIAIIDDNGSPVSFASDRCSWRPDLTSHGQKLASVAAAGDRLIQVVEYDRKTGQTRARRRNGFSRPEYFGNSYTLELPSTTGRTVHVCIYEPHNPEYSGAPGTLPPFIVQVHGGPTAQALLAARPPDLYWTTRGFGIIDVNYGGSTGFGRRYRETLNGNWGVVDVQDVLAAAHGVIELGIADPDRLVIRGASAGGWTALSAVINSDVFAAAMTAYGVTDIARFASQTHDFESSYLLGLIGDPVRDVDTYEQRSPINHVDQINCPILIIQGAQDRIVPLEQAEALRASLARRGVPHRMVVFEDEGHGFRQLKSTTAALAEELDFYREVLGLLSH